MDLSQFTCQETVVIPSTITSIPDGAFRNCVIMMSVYVPSSVTSIGDSSFSGCTGISQLNLPSALKSIGGFTFQGMTKLTSVTVPATVTSMGQQIFKDSKSLTSVTLPTGIASSFGCTSTVVSPSNACFAFLNCAAFTSVSIAATVGAIGIHAFMNCPTIKTVNFLGSLTSIGSYAFDSCSSLVSVSGLSAVAKIGAQIVRNCNSLKSVTLSNAVASSFGCSSTVVSSSDACFAFLNCNILTTVTTLGIQAFSYCPRITSVTIPNSVTDIGNNAFGSSNSLATINLINCEGVTFGSTIFSGTNPCVQPACAASGLKTCATTCSGQNTFYSSGLGTTTHANTVFIGEEIKLTIYGTKDTGAKSLLYSNANGMGLEETVNHEIVPGYSIFIEGLKSLRQCRVEYVKCRR